MKYLLFTVLLLSIFCAPAISSAADNGLLHLAQFQPREKTLEDFLGLSPEPDAPLSEDHEKDRLLKRYRNDCLAHPTPGLSINAQHYICGCATSEMAVKMELGEIQGLYQATPETAKHRYKFYTQIYSQCLGLPIQQFVRNNCQNNPALKDAKKAEKQRFSRACSCTADTMKRLMEQEGDIYMGRALQLDWDAPDPLATLLGDKQFIRKNDGFMRRCIEIHVDDLP